VPPFSGSYVNYVQRLPLGTVGLVGSLAEREGVAGSTSLVLSCLWLCGGWCRSRRGTIRC
jgi:hypothetical protein